MKEHIQILPKVVRNGDWHIEEINLPENRTMSLQVKPVYTEVDLKELHKQLNEISQKANSIQNNKQWLLERQFIIDKKISDILHYLEFYSISASDGHKLSKMLQDTRRERRKVKNELESIGVLSSGCAQVLNQHVQKTIRGMESVNTNQEAKNKFF